MSCGGNFRLGSLRPSSYSYHASFCHQILQMLIFLLKALNVFDHLLLLSSFTWFEFIRALLIIRSRDNDLHLSANTTCTVLPPLGTISLDSWSWPGKVAAARGRYIHWWSLNLTGVRLQVSNVSRGENLAHALCLLDSFILNHWCWCSLGSSY